MRASATDGRISGTALTGALECTVKVAQRSQAALFARADAHFETL